MKRLATIVLTVALACGVSACATTPSNLAPEGSGSVQAEQAVAVEEEAETEPATFDPIDLCRDNPFGDADIDSVALRLAGVGEYELTGTDAETLMGILQNDNRVWQDHTGNNSGFEWTYYKTTTYPIRLYVNLASGQELELQFYEASGTSTNILRIDDEEDFDLSSDEFDDAVAIRDRAYEALTDELDETVAPFADLSLDQLDHIERIRHYMEEDQSEQVLSDEEAERVIETLKGLELEPATADFDPQTMFGGYYAYFELWFENGEHYSVGSHTSYPIYDDNGTRLDSYPVAFIDSIVYRCNMDYASDISRDYTATKEEYRDYYFAEGISASEYPYESVTADDIELVTVGLMNGTYQYSPDLVTSGIAPESTYEAIAEVLRQLRISDDNSVSMFDATEGISTTSIRVCFSNGEKDEFSIYNGTLRIGYMYQYTQDDDVIDAFVGLIADVQDAYYDYIDSVGPTHVVTSQIPGYETGNHDIDSRYLTFELPEALVYHDDGYYPEGYTLEDAPISVTFFGYSGWNGNVDADSNQYRLDHAKSASDGTGIYSTFLEFNHVTGDYYSDWYSEPGRFEILFSNGAMNVIEIDIKGDADYEIAPEAIFARIIATLDDSNNY